VLGIVSAGGPGFVLNEVILGLGWARARSILLVSVAVAALSEVLRTRLT
jgi:hypothetical protein